jgi:hypothetical protein
LNTKAAELRKQLSDLALEMRDKSDIGLDRIEAIEAEITAKSAELDAAELEDRQAAVDARLAELDDRIKAFSRDAARTKAAAELVASLKQQLSEGAPARRLRQKLEPRLFVIVKDASTMVLGMLGDHVTRRRINTWIRCRPQSGPACEREDGSDELQHAIRLIGPGRLAILAGARCSPHLTVKAHHALGEP